MSPELKQFIKENKDLINQNSKESWEEIYSKLDSFMLRGEFTEIILSADIDPAKILGYIPNYYLCGSNIISYKNPNRVTSIGHSAFSNCYNLTSMVIGDSITSIEPYTFYSCRSLTSVEISNSVTSIGLQAFYNCSNLKEINFKGTKEQAIQLGIGNRSRKKWRENSAIEKIVCSDGEINL